MSALHEQYSIQSLVLTKNKSAKKENLSAVRWVS